MHRQGHNGVLHMYISLQSKAFAYVGVVYGGTYMLNQPGDKSEFDSSEEATVYATTSHLSVEINSRMKQCLMQGESLAKDEEKKVDVNTNEERIGDLIIGVARDDLDASAKFDQKSDGINTALFRKREHLENLYQTRNLLPKVQFIYDLTARLKICTKSEDNGDARFYFGAVPIIKVYGDTSFQDCIIKKNLHTSDSESVVVLAFNGFDIIKYDAEEDRVMEFYQQRRILKR